MPRSGSAASYLICATPRTGSTLLCGLLRSSGVAGVPQSYFRVPDESSWADRWQVDRGPDGSFDYRDFLLSAIKAGSTPNGVFGARVMWGTIDELVSRIGALRPGSSGTDLDLLTAVFGPTRFLHLRREDAVAQAVSWARAEQTDFWQHGGTASPGRRPHFNFEQIDSCFQTISDHNRAWGDWFAASDIQPHPVVYEELTADMVGTTRGILSFLGIEPPGDRRIAPCHHRQADEINRAWINRYRDSVTRPGQA